MGLRSQALNTIARLSAKDCDARKFHLRRLEENGQYGRSGKGVQINGEFSGIVRVSEVPMTITEFDVLISLCQAAPTITSLAIASRLLDQLAPYLKEAHSQHYKSSPSFSAVDPSPWEALTCHLTSALLCLGLRHVSLHKKVHRAVLEYVDGCCKTFRDTGEGATQKLASLSVSLLGFLRGASTFTVFWDTSELLAVTDILRNIFIEEVLIQTEGIFSSIRTSEHKSAQQKEWKGFVKRYAAAGRPLGAILLQHAFLQFLTSASALQLLPASILQRQEALDALMSLKAQPVVEASEDTAILIKVISDIAVDQIHLLKEGADYLQLGSAWQQRLGFSLKASTLITFLICSIVDEEIADFDVLVSWLDETIADPVQMADDDLADVVLRIMTITARLSPEVAVSLSRSLPRFIVQGGIKGKTVEVVASSLTSILRHLSQDAIITSLYSLGNVLSAGSKGDQRNGIAQTHKVNGHVGRNLEDYNQHAAGSAISLDLDADDDPGLAYSNIIRAVVLMATSCRDEKIAALALSMLLQKLGRINSAVDIHIISETATLAVQGTSAELKSLLKLHSRLSHEGVLQNNNATLTAIAKARSQLAVALAENATMNEVYFIYLLESIISKGDVHERDNTHEIDVQVAAREILLLLESLATLLKSPNTKVSLEGSEEIKRLFREAWFNIVVHGITLQSAQGQRHRQQLKAFAGNTNPLVSEERADQHESDIELNSVLRRGMNGPRTAEQKKHLTTLIPGCESEIRSLSYPQVIFLITTYTIESLRAVDSRCTTMLHYFRDPSVEGNAMQRCMLALSEDILTTFIRSSIGPSQINSAPRIADQLVALFSGCCQSNVRVQQVAFRFADKIIGQRPASLCQKASLFALFELLSMMWTSCLESELDDYSWKSTHYSAKGNVSVDLSDDFQMRRRTLDAFYQRARKWVMTCISVAAMDIKALIQTYLSEHDDSGAFGHIALGRSFALEMGTAIPPSDYKLAGIETHGTSLVDTSSDFIAQYTTRQEYRYPSAISGGVAKFKCTPDSDSVGKSPSLFTMTKEAEMAVNRLETRLRQKASVKPSEIRDALRSAAAILCKSPILSVNLVHQLVKLPFLGFTKDSMKFGISLWIGIINERVALEPRLIAEIGSNLEKTVKLDRGAFSERLRHVDPFYVKEEFAPSDKASLSNQQVVANALLAPHLRTLQFLTSHYNIVSCGSFHTQRMFYRIAASLLHGLKRAHPHPLAREWFFQTLLFGLNILRTSVGLLQTIRWRLKDLILTAGLRWFAGHPSWSFGGNRLHVKAEIQLMSDVATGLKVVQALGQQDLTNLRSLASKQSLFLSLVENEQARLHAWLYPLEPGKAHFLPYKSPDIQGQDIITNVMLKTAWIENPSLAIQIADRFPGWSVQRDVRNFILNDPTKAIDEPQALAILLGSALPTDVESMTKYMLFWAPVDPITAVTYFLPEFSHHPLLIQYAMRALDSHAVDVTFFYVPQIVQALRYDALGYVQRYIVETAKFSQLFAHQIIWNMKANAYKDEDSTIEDSLKPILDNVTENMLTSFSGADKTFYEREFSFFNEITDISGKLRPFIKRSKPEKKQKIEEELRKIKVDVGVYLPSNPEGTVIGIDRKSGKPLQSHAKAPYMATFRIKKYKASAEAQEDLTDETGQHHDTGREGQQATPDTYEAWQSAIFKVGDDCRQDMLVLQIIAAFRGIFNNVGLDVYVYPYRVTATAPGCGVIDVLPNSISRDMLGREAVNGLYEYFISKYGAETSTRFQEARNNFVKSMAAYSVISYLLQLKDRHNGNIMIDDAGHILHIDFGFCFDIAPGGVRFERAPFKLTSEMVSVMGGSTTSQSYIWFEELCIKAFLAARPHAERICHLVRMMLGSGLPCFKSGATIKHLRERFVLEKGEREASGFMRGLIQKSHGSYSTKGYDQFQLLTNGIPY